MNALRNLYPKCAVAGVPVMANSTVWFALSEDPWPILAVRVGALGRLCAVTGNQLRGRR